jgi:hypothetical protein
MACKNGAPEPLHRSGGAHGASTRPVTTHRCEQDTDLTCLGHCGRHQTLEVEPSLP